MGRSWSTIREVRQGDPVARGQVRKTEVARGAHEGEQTSEMTEERRTHSPVEEIVQFKNYLIKDHIFLRNNEMHVIDLSTIYHFVF